MQSFYWLPHLMSKLQWSYSGNQKKNWMAKRTMKQVYGEKSRNGGKMLLKFLIAFLSPLVVHLIFIINCHRV